MDSATLSVRAAGPLRRIVPEYCMAMAAKWPLQNGRCNLAAERMGDLALTFP
jgi:hypothetical protein